MPTRTVAHLGASLPASDDVVELSRRLLPNESVTVWLVTRVVGVLLAVELLPVRRELPEPERDPSA